MYETFEEYNAGENREKPIIDIEWTKLRCANEFTYFKSDCPVCGYGLLFVGRDRNTLELEEHDWCTFCNQRFRYKDIAEMRQMEQGKLPFPEREINVLEPIKL